jgi:nucleoside-diphosphate-sugar epimerase
MRCAVTGSNGYIGRHVVASLLDLGHDVIAVSRGPERGLVRPTEYVQLDVLETPTCAFQALHEPDVCIHLAWQDGFQHRSLSHFKNIQSHITFLENLISGGLKHFVGLGTMHEIGYHVGPISGATPANPVHPYGIAKNYLRQVQAYLCESQGVAQQWLRCFYIVGDDEKNNSVFTKLLAAAQRGESSMPFNSGELLYDFIEVKELAKLIATVSTQSKVTGTINCASGRPVALRTMIERFIVLHALSIVPRWGELPSRPYDSPAIWADVSKLDAAMTAASHVEQTNNDV